MYVKLLTSDSELRQFLTWKKNYWYSYAYSIYLHMLVYPSACLDICLSMCACVCVCLYTHAHICMYIYVCIYIYLYIYICRHNLTTYDVLGANRPFLYSAFRNTQVSHFFSVCTHLKQWFRIYL